VAARAPTALGSTSVPEWPSPLRALPDQASGAWSENPFGGVAAAAGIVRLLCYAYGWAVFFLVIGALNLAGVYWYLGVARSRTQREAFRPQS
jgi:O-antigen/teichoic acid export membrane protein